MEKELTNLKSDNNNIYDASQVKYLMHQYPWFSKEQIVEAMNTQENKLGKILSYLDSKSGSYPELFGF